MNPSLLLHFLIFFTSFTLKASSSSSSISYSDHCNFYAPEAIPTDRIFTRFALLDPVTSHFTGGQNILDEDPQSQWSILFQTNGNIFKTNIVNTYKIQAELKFYSSYKYDPAYNYSGEHPRVVYFHLEGFWSVSTSKLCMVGSAHWLTKQGKPLTLNAVLKLKYARLVNMNNSLVSGILESLASPNDSNYFGPISMLGFPQVTPLKYTYTLESNEERNVTRTVQNPVTSMKYLDVCSIFLQRFITYKLEYPSNCKNCSLFGHDRNGYLPAFISLYVIQCSREDNKLRVLVEFQDRRFTPYEQPFRPDISFIGEGTWNGGKDELVIAACHILNHNDPLGSARVGDCPIGMSLWFPPVRSIMKTHNTEGQIWTTKFRDDLGMFRMAKFQSFDHISESYALKYEYTQMEKVRRICPKTKHLGAKYQRGEYQSGYYSFEMSVNHKSMVSSGFVDPFFVAIPQFNNDAFMNKDLAPWQEAVSPVADISTSTYSGPVNVSFEISFMLNISSISRSGISSLNLSSTDNHRVEISAEGVYDDESGQICMIGCRNLIKSASFDCEILVKFQFPRAYGNGGLVKGSIESLREKNDALYFENLDIVSRVFTEKEARESIWRMDLEIIMVLISGTLMCVLTRQQLYHMKRRSEMVNSISVLMMLILTIGHMIPLVLNHDAIFSNGGNHERVEIRRNGLIEVNEVIVRIVTMVAFILQSRLLQLTWIAKKNHWIHEMRTLFICLPVYIIGGSVMLLVSWINNYRVLSQRSIWGGLRSYAGLTLDGFLFPQLILNIFQVSKGNALSHSFYIGTTFVRLLPHGYDLYRRQKYMSHQFDRFYIYANPRTDFYSPCWDIVIICGGLMFAVIFFLQRCFGGQFMFPRRFREHVKYEMIPVTSNE